MAKKKLKGIIWPNLPNDEYILDADKVEYDDTETYSEGSVGDALQNKANIDGSYENLTAGNAEQLTTNIRANDQAPYLFRTSGGSVDIGDREYINGIVGGTVAWNQLFNKAATVVSSESATIERDATTGVITWTISSVSQSLSWYQNCSQALQNHKVLAVQKILSNKACKYAVRIENAAPSYVSIPANTATVVAIVKAVPRYSGTAALGGFIAEFEADTVVTISDVQFFDLTQMFGSTIADYIYSLEQANAGAGVAFFKTLFPKPYYAYNAGELKSVKGLISHDMVGFNAWDEEWEPYGSSGQIKSKNRIRVVAGASYFIKSPKGCTFYKFADETSPNIGFFVASANSVFTVPSDTHYLVMYTDTNYGTTYNHDICINLSWDGSRNGEYEAYQKWSYPLDSDLELRGIPKLDASNNLYYDGDVYEADGTVTRKYGVVDLGTLSWSYDSITNRFIATVSGMKRPSSNFVKANILCHKYVTLASSDTEVSTGNNSIGVSMWGTMGVRDEAKGTDATAFKTAMSGVYLVYELATPTTESADQYTNPQIVDDFGTEEFVISNTVGVPIPVGHNTDYPINLKAKVEMMPNSPSGNGDYIVRQTSGENEYVSIADNSIVGGLVTRCPAASGENGTYVLKATISDGTVTYAWVAEE